MALELSYLVTTFGSQDNSADGDLEAQQILGDVMRVFHDIPIIGDSLHEQNDPSRPLISIPAWWGSWRDDQDHQRPATLDDIARIWTESNFRRAVTYTVSSVQIDSKRPRRTALPVREPRVYVFPLRSPFIDSVSRVPPFDNTGLATVESGDTIQIDGRNFAGAGVSVRIDATEVPLLTQTDNRITVVLPTTLAAGVRLVQVRSDLRIETTPGAFETRRGFESNVVPLALLPRIVYLLPNGATAGGTRVPPRSSRRSCRSSARRCCWVTSRCRRCRGRRPASARRSSSAFRRLRTTSPRGPIWRGIAGSTAPKAGWRWIPSPASTRAPRTM